MTWYDRLVDRWQRWVPMPCFEYRHSDVGCANTVWFHWRDRVWLWRAYPVKCRCGGRAASSLIVMWHGDHGQLLGYDADGFPIYETVSGGSLDMFLLFVSIALFAGGVMILWKQRKRIE